MEVEDLQPAREAVGRRVPQGEAPRGEFTYSVVEPGVAKPRAPPRPRAPAAKPKPATVQAAAAPRTLNRRNEGRTKSHLREGFVAGPRRNPLVDCRIRDLSRGGAKLSLEADLVLPRTFLLVEAGTRATYRATLAWQKGRDAGVRLTPI